MGALRITELEAKAIGACCISVQTVSAPLLMMFSGISRKRADELEELFCVLTEDEVRYIRSFLE